MDTPDTMRLNIFGVGRESCTAVPPAIYFSVTASDPFGGRLVGLSARAMAVSTVLVAVASLALLAAALWVRAFYLSSAAFADEHPIFLGSLEVAINTDMSLVLALVTTVFAVSVAVALWCGLLHRLLEGGGIIAEAAEAVAAMPALLLVIPPVVSVLLVGLFFFWGYVALLIATAGTPIKGELAYDRPLQWLLPTWMYKCI